MSATNEAGHEQAITEADLDEVDRLDREATPGPWVSGILDYENENGGRSSHSEVRSGEDDVLSVATRHGPNLPDAVFIARARTLLPRLAAEVRAHRARPTPILCVTGLVVDGDKVALVRSRKRGGWELPGGKITPEDRGDWRVALSREIREETGQQIEPAAWSVTDVLIGKPAPGAEFASTIIVARAAGRGALTAGDDAADAGWFKRDELPSDLSKLESLKVLRAWATGALAEERIVAISDLAERRLARVEELAAIVADMDRRLAILTESAEKVASQNSVMLAALERSTDPNMRALAEKIRRTT